MVVLRTIQLDEKYRWIRAFTGGDWFGALGISD
jgi:hypothetical protein